ncbi:uncharacterized protein CPUR_03216 [Claviceps purpurea 20.1]|uniref:Uncharacterized protein n=1 Tax=Claviceps purpurea (strain 20.1) TaxID=1111077 RepID=M1WH73_CLAP2|nr:uncharacterized protein CPUR_03216 [Claviceps purpurea 20.1]
MASTPEDSGDEGRVSTPETFPDCWQCKQTLPAVLQTQETVLRFLRRQWGAGGRGDVNLDSWRMERLQGEATEQARKALPPRTYQVRPPGHNGGNGDIGPDIIRGGGR